jgi:hypothetical protein
METIMEEHFENVLFQKTNYQERVILLGWIESERVPSDVGDIFGSKIDLSAWEAF